MKTKKRSNNKKLLLTIGIPVIVAALIGSAALGYVLLNPSNTADNTQDTQTDTQQDQATDKPDTDSNTDTDNLPDKDDDQQVPVDQDDGTTEPEDSSLERPVITRASVSGSSFKSVATFQSSSSGECEFVFAATGTPSVIYRSSIVVGPSYYYCSLSADLSDFAASENWTLTVKHKTQTGSITSEPKEVTIP